MLEAKELSFVDTNVLVYAFERTDSPKSRAAQRLIGDLMDQDGLRVSTQVLQELFITLTQEVARPCSAAKALAVLDDVTAWPLVVIDYIAIRSAAKLADRARISFGDALAVVAAAQSGASILYTEDLNHGQEIPGVRITNPFRAA